MSTIKTNQLAHTANGASVYTLPTTDGSAGQVLKTDGSGNLSWTTPSQGISMIDSWRLTADTGNGINNTIFNWAAATNLLASSLGSALSYSSGTGTFSFPSTGHYLMTFVCRFHCSSGNDSELNVELKITENNSSYSVAAHTAYGAQEGATKSDGTIIHAFDITDISNQKFQFHTDSMGSTSQLRGNSTINETYFQVVRLGDT